jgi:hypothetical protein
MPLNNGFSNSFLSCKSVSGKIERVQFSRLKDEYSQGYRLKMSRLKIWEHYLGRGVQNEQ